MYEELVKVLREPCPHENCELCYEAADAIEELTATAESYKRSMEAWADEAARAHDMMPRWVPMTERLPKEGEFVLVYGNLYPNKHDGGVVAVSKRMDWNYWQGFGRERNITHWMPLPEPPKEEPAPDSKSTFYDLLYEEGGANTT